MTGVTISFFMKGDETVRSMIDGTLIRLNAGVGEVKSTKLFGCGAGVTSLAIADFLSSSFFTNGDLMPSHSTLTRGVSGRLCDDDVP